MNHDFPRLDPSFVAKQDAVTNAFLRDYVTVRDGLLREMASLKSEKTMAMDHQHKVVRHAIGQKARYSFTIVGDGGIVLGYYAVPDDGEAWIKAAMLEMVARHGAVLDDYFKKPILQGSTEGYLR